MISESFCVAPFNQLGKCTLTKMDDLPYAKRHPTVVVTPRRERKCFDPIDYNQPLNKQQFNDRPTQMGAAHPRGLKINAKVIDARPDIGERDRINLFNDPYRVHTPQITRPPPPPDFTGRHVSTPYKHTTKWITEPAENTSLAPLKSELFKVVFLNCPTDEEDKIRKSREQKAKLETLHYFDQKNQNYIQQTDKELAIRDKRLLHNYQHQRNAHQDALELRRRREKIRYFD